MNKGSEGVDEKGDTRPSGPTSTSRYSQESGKRTFLRSSIGEDPGLVEVSSLIHCQ